MSVVSSSLTEAPFGLALELIEDFRGELSALEALLIAQRKQAGFSETSTETIIKRSGKVSKGEAKKRTKRSNAIEKNPGIANKMTKGEISTEQVDLLADASAKTGGDAAADDELIEQIAGANPDQGKAIVRDYVDNHNSHENRDSRYARQRRRRKAYKGRSVNGLSSLVIEGDDESIDAALKAIRKNADGMYREDGGRDVANAQHERTHDQRMFDAAINKLVGGADNASAAGSSGPAKPAPPGNRPGERPTMVFRSDISGLTNDPEELAAWKAELIGTGLVPSTLASYYRCISDVAVQLVDADGIILKHGRSKRRVTPEQWIGLVVRDRGCVDCGAHHTMCEAHHLIPWTAPAKGDTNIDNMVLMCVDCHHRLHEANFTLEYDPYLKKWLKRPATWAETPGSGPPRRPKKRSTKPETRAASTSRSAKAQRALANW